MFKLAVDLMDDIGYITPEHIAAEAKTLRAPAIGMELAGNLPLELQKVWVLKAHIIKRLEDEKGSLMGSMFELTPEMTLGEAADLLSDKFDARSQRIEDIKTFFWLAVKAELKITNSGRIGVRENWRVYYVDAPCKSCNRRHSGIDAVVVDLGEFSGFKDIFAHPRGPVGQH
jgi:hypothetical protein